MALLKPTPEVCTFKGPVRVRLGVGCVQHDASAGLWSLYTHVKMQRFVSMVVLLDKHSMPLHGIRNRNIWGVIYGALAMEREKKIHPGHVFTDEIQFVPTFCAKSCPQIQCFAICHCHSFLQEHVLVRWTLFRKSSTVDRTNMTGDVC